MQQLNNSFQVLSKLSDMQHFTSLRSTEYFDIFLHVLFINGIYKLNLDDSIVFPNATWKDTFQTQDAKEHILYKVIPELIASNDSNISTYFRNVSYLFEQIDEKSLRDIIFIVNSMELEKMGKNGRYEFIEKLLDSIAEKEGRRGGKFSERTPKLLRDFITEILNPKKSESIADLTSGTGALLLSACKYIDSTFNAVNESSYYAVEIYQPITQLLIMHSYLSGIRNINIANYDLLKNFEIDDKNKKFDKIYGNPPFAVRVNPEEISPAFSIHTRNADVHFIDAMLSSLKKNGKVTTIVTQGMLANTSRGHISLRKKLLEEVHVEAVISLPVSVFNTSIPLFLLVFKNQISSKPILYMDLAAKVNKKDKNLVKERLQEGVSFYKQYEQLSANEILEQDLFQDNELFWLVEQERVIEKDYILDFELYRPEKETNFIDLNIILDGMHEKMSHMLHNIKTLQSLIKEENNVSLKQVELGELYNVQSGRQPSSRIELEEGSLPLVKITDITKLDGFVISEVDKNISEEDAKNHPMLIVEKGAILLSVRGTLGSVAIAGKRMCVGNNLVAITPKNKNIDTWLLFGYFLSKKHIFRTQVSSVIPSLSMTLIKSLKIPSLDETQEYLEFKKAIQVFQDVIMTYKKSSIEMDAIPQALFSQFFTSKEEK